MNPLQSFYRRIFYRRSGNASPKSCNKKNSFELLSETVGMYAIVMLDAHGLVLTWNNGAGRIIGYTSGEIIGKSFSTFYNQQDIYDGSLSHHLQMTKMYGFYETDGWRVRNNGSCFYANTVFTALKDEDGHLYGYATITQDITLQKRIQQQLEILSQQVNQSNESIYTLDADHKITSWNRGAEKLYGYTYDEALGKVPNELLQTDISAAELSAALQMINDEGNWTEELKRVTKSGNIIYVRSSTSCIRDGAGTLSGMIGVSFDITAKKKMQDECSRLASVVEQSADGIRVIGLDGKILTWNKGSALLHGYTKEEAIGNTPAGLGIINLTKQEQQLFIKAVIKKGFVETERRLFHKNGSSFFASITASVHKNNDGVVDSIIFSTKDITLRKSLEEQLIKSNEELEQKVKERTEEIYKKEKQFRALIENSQSIITLFDKDFKPVYRSPAGERITGWTAEDRMKYSLLDQIHPDYQAKQVELFKNVLENPGKTYEFTTHSLHKAGHYIWLEGVVTNMLHDPGVAGIISNLADITERREAADAIRKSEILYRSLFENILHGFAYCKAIFEDGKLVDYIYLNVNEEYGLLTGLTGVTGKKVTEAVPGLFESDPFYAEIIGRVALQGVPEKMETYVKPLGLWLSISLYSPEKEYFVALVDNITERKKAEEAIQKSEILYRSLFENMLHGFAYCKAIIEEGKPVDFIYMAVNQEYELITGLTNTVGKKLSELAPGLLDSDPEYARVIKHVALTGQSAKFETYAAPLAKWFSIAVYSPEKGYFVTLADNITERRNAEEAIQKSEKLYRSLFENMLHGFAYCRGIYEDGLLTDFTYITVNTEYELMHNRFNLNGKKISEVIPDLLSSDSTYKDILTRVSLLGTLEKIETFVKPLGKWFSISLYSPAKEHFVILADDITDRKQHEQKITSLNEALEERVLLRTEQLKKTNEELEAFSYSVSHDLRAPLRGITGFTTILEEDYTNKLDDEAKRITAVIKNNALRMGLLIDDLLAFSRMSRQDIVKTTVDMTEIINEIINETNLIRNDQPEIAWIMHPMPAVKADINTIRQVWVNLISNAVKYTGKCAHPKIETGAYVHNEEVVFYVKDNGAGFDDKYINKLFRVFQRLHSHEEFEGTGIGLAIVEKIISKHNGKVWAEASVNKGASFYFSLPASIKKEKSFTNKIKLQ